MSRNKTNHESSKPKGSFMPALSGLRLRFSLNSKYSALISFSLVFSLSLLIAQTVNALDHRSGDRIIINEQTRLDDDLLITGKKSEIDCLVDGDVLNFSRDFRLRGNVTGAVVVACEAATIEGRVEHSLAIACERAFVSGEVEGSSYIVAMKIEISEEATFLRDAVFCCDSLYMAGSIASDLICYTAAVTTISGSIAGDLEIESDESVRILETAHIGGDLIIHGSAEPEIEEGAVISGEVVRLVGDSNDNDDLSLSEILGKLYLFGMLFTFALLTLSVSRAHFVRSSTAVTKETLRSIAFGIVAVLAGGMFCMILTVTIVGILPAAIMFVLILLLMLLLGPIYVAGGMGRLIFSSKKGDGFGITIMRVFVGLGILMFISSIPVIGVISYCIAGVLGFGAFIVGAYSKSSSRIVSKLKIQSSNDSVTDQTNSQ